MLKNSLILLFTLFVAAVHAQVVSTLPVFPRSSNEVTIYFDASQGTGGLVDCNCDIYIHTGVITTESTSGSDWKHVNMQWGVANEDWKLTPVSGIPNLYSYVIAPSIEDYYGLDVGEEVLELAFVFRNADGSLEGKGDGGSDIYYPIYPDDLPFSTLRLAPNSNTLLKEIGEEVYVKFATSEEALMTIFHDEVQVAQNLGTLIEHSIEVTEVGTHTVEIITEFGGEVYTDVFTYVVAANTPVVALPEDTQIGINRVSGTEVTLVIRAPGKNNIFVFGSFNGYNLSTDYQMNKTPDGQYFWLTITGLSPDETYTYQYLVDGGLKVADPLSELILDPQNDASISEETFPNMPLYPVGLTEGHVTVLEMSPEVYEWQVLDFEAPEQEDLVVYELLVRDFIEARNYTTLIDTLDYFVNLGVNAIELMPVNEFENNNSWGYNPSYHKALDKYYGSPYEFKRFIDECHQRGIAVILDVVYNHAFGQNPFVQMWFDGKPTEDNPYFNRDAKHPFNVGYDMNHESSATKEYVKNITAYWLNEYNIDGFRFDLSKGFTQTNTPDNVGAWGLYDDSRISILKEYADHIWAVSDPNTYVILEHFAANNEEKELTDYRMMTWGNENHDYNEASMGYGGNNFYGVTHFSRGFTDPSLVGYMESHDEERLMYRNLTFGNSNVDNSYSVKFLWTALRRQELVSTFFYPLVGPKMLWQFGEVGYDYSIDFNGRVGEKPVRWDYFEEESRRRLYDVTASLIHLRRNYPAFKSLDVEYPDNSNSVKRIRINGEDMDVIILGNFGIIPLSIEPSFHHSGDWFRYFTGEEVNITNVNEAIELQPGEYRLYTDVQLPEPTMGYIDTYTSTEELINANFEMAISPNPSSGNASLSYILEQDAEVEIEVFNLKGQLIGTVLNEKMEAGQHSYLFQNLAVGNYLVRLKANKGVQAMQLVVIK